MFANSQPSLYPCFLVTRLCALTGELKAAGGVMRYLNDVNRPEIELLNTTALALDPGARLTGNFAQSRLMAVKSHTQFLGFGDEQPLGTRQRPGDAKELVVYTERFQISAIFYISFDRQLADLLDPNNGGHWVIATDAVLTPVLPTAAAAPTTAKLLLLNKSVVLFFHLETD